MWIVEIALLTCLVVTLWRLFRGPTPWDRLLAYNTASNRIVALLAITAVVADQLVLLDVALVYVALSFLGILILARSMERSGGTR
jgi:multicomponent Na+:H+ antiporter subunit F